MTTFDTANLTALTDTDLASVGTAWQAERDRRNLIGQYAQRQAQAQAQAQAALAAVSTTAPAYVAGTVYSPTDRVTYNGDTYWWPGPGTLHDTTPGDAAHPFWVLIPAPPAPVTPFTSGMTLAVGQLVSNAGHTYRYQGAPQTSAPANYAPTGTVSTSAWQFVG